MLNQKILWWTMKVMFIKLILEVVSFMMIIIKTKWFKHYNIIQNFDCKMLSKELINQLYI